MLLLLWRVEARSQATFSERMHATDLARRESGKHVGVFSRREQESMDLFKRGISHPCDLVCYICVPVHLLVLQHGHGTSPPVLQQAMTDSTAVSLIAFARLPVPGKVKTRLAASCGPQAACDFYSASLVHCLQEAQKYVCSCNVQGAGIWSFNWM